MNSNFPHHGRYNMAVGGCGFVFQVCPLIPLLWEVSFTRSVDPYSVTLVLEHWRSGGMGWTSLSARYSWDRSSRRIGGSTGLGRLGVSCQLVTLTKAS